MSEAQTMMNFELVSPEERLISEPVAMATIPGEEGEFGVALGHSALVASLKPGVVKLQLADGEAREVFITGGFADVTGELCTILAEQAVNLSDMDQGAIEQELKDLNDDLGLAEGETDKKRIERKIILAKAKLTAVTGELVL